VVAAALGLRLRLPVAAYLVRKLRAPINEEFAFGAVAEDGPPLLDTDTLGALRIGSSYVNAEVAAQRAEIERQRQAYGGRTKLPNLTSSDVVLVDDGIATGATVEAAVRGLRGRGCRSIGVATPVASGLAVERLRPLCDWAEVLSTPPDFFAVGQYYRQFPQVTDEEVLACLRGLPER